MLQGGTAVDFGRRAMVVRSMGATPSECEQYGSNPPPGCPGYNNPSSSSGSGSGKVTVDKITDLLNQGMNLFSNIKNPQSGTMVPAPGGPKPNNTLKFIVIGLVSVAAVAGGIAIYRSSNKKKKS